MYYIFNSKLIISTSPAVLSNITLALLEDSGWYSVNYGLASVLNWGLGRSRQNYCRWRSILVHLFMVTSLHHIITVVPIIYNIRFRMPICLGILRKFQSISLFMPTWNAIMYKGLSINSELMYLIFKRLQVSYLIGLGLQLQCFSWWCNVNSLKI